MDCASDISVICVMCGQNLSFCRLARVLWPPTKTIGIIESFDTCAWNVEVNKQLQQRELCIINHSDILKLVIFVRPVQKQEEPNEQMRKKSAWRIQLLCAPEVWRARTLGRKRCMAQTFSVQSKPKLFSITLVLTLFSDSFCAFIRRAVNIVKPAKLIPQTHTHTPHPLPPFHSQGNIVF